MAEENHSIDELYPGLLDKIRQDRLRGHFGELIDAEATRFMISKTEVSNDEIFVYAETMWVERQTNYFGLNSFEGGVVWSSPLSSITAGVGVGDWIELSSNDGRRLKIY